MQNQTIQLVFEDFEGDGKKAIDFLKSEYAVLKAGRANPKMLDKVFVDYYGTRTPLSQMANISVPEARLIVVNLWDISAITEVRKALQNADLGASIADDGKTIRLTLPTLTEERRKDLVKQVKKLGEEAKISIRNLRREALDVFKALKKDSEISEDNYEAYEKQIQKQTDDFNEQIDKLAQNKESEVMEV